MDARASSIPVSPLDMGCHAVKAIGGLKQFADHLGGTGLPCHAPDLLRLLAVIVGSAPLSVVHRPAKYHAHYSPIPL
jgi:hypothetical protein